MTTLFASSGSVCCFANQSFLWLSLSDRMWCSLGITSRRILARAKSLVLCGVALLLLGAISAPAQAQSVTFAGVQTTVASGLHEPYGVAVDGVGDVFIADYYNGPIIEVPAGGGAQTTVGSGLYYPLGVAVDGAGNVFIVDSGNYRVVEVPAGGGAQITVAATGLKFPSSVAVDGAGDVFIADTYNSRVVEVPAGGGTQVTVSASGLLRPRGVAVDGAGDIFIADTYSSWVVEVPAGGSAQTTVGSGLNAPWGVAVDGAGDVFIGDSGNNRVVEVLANGGAQVTVPTSGLSEPTAVAVDGAGDVFIADEGNNRVVEVQLAAVNFGNINVCPAGQTSPAPCNQTLTLNYNVAATTTFGTTSIVTQGAPNLDFQLGSGSTCAGTISAGGTCTVNVAFAPLAPGARMGAVQQFDNSGDVLATAMVHGIGQGPIISFSPSIQTTVPASGLEFPFGAAVDAAGDVFIADTYDDRVVEVPYLGNGTYGPQTTVPASGLNFPYGVAVDGAGDVFIADTFNSRVVEVPYLGNGTYGPQTTVNTGIYTLAYPQSVAVDGAGDVFIANTDDGLLSGVMEVLAGGGQAWVGPMNPELRGACGVAVDGTGDVFIADTLNNRVVEIPAGGGAQTTVPASGLKQPQGVTVDGAGDLFIADTYNLRVVEVPAGGGAQTTVNTGIYTLSSFPRSVAVDGAGDVFIADTSIAGIGNYLVLDLQRSQPPSLSFASTVVGSTSSDSPQSVIIQNVGNQPLNALAPGLIVAGPNFVQVPGSGTPPDCSSAFALAPGATCNLSISFQPQSNGNLTGTATFTDNALNANPSATQNIALQGTGTTTISQTITCSAAPASAVYGSSFTIMCAGGGSGNPVMLTASGACSGSGSNSAMYTMISGTGTCAVVANQAGTSLYSAAPQFTESVNAVPLNQTITFITPAPPTSKKNDSFTVSATGGASGNPVTFTVGAGSVCSITGSAVDSATYKMSSDTGNCYVVANQAGNNNYAAAQGTETVNAVATVVKIAPTVSFTGAPGSAAYLSTFTVAATENSGVTPTITSTTGMVCTVSGNVVTMKSGTGTCTVKASWAADTYYLAASLMQSTTATLLGTGTSITNTATLTPTNLKKVTVYFTVTNGQNAVTGNVTVTASTGEHCTGTVTAGKCVVTFTATGANSLTAVYAGNTDDATSSSAGYALTVN